MEKSKLLSLAKRFLWDGWSPHLPGQTEYICYALECAYDANKGTDGLDWLTLRAVQGAVLHHIHPYPTVGGMLAAKIGYARLIPPVVQAKRLEIMDLLIAQLEKEEAALSTTEL